MSIRSILSLTATRNALRKSSNRNQLAIRQISTSLIQLNQASDETILTTIKSQLKDAMKAKDSNSVSVLKSLLSDHQYSKISSSTTPPTLISLIRKAISKRQEAVTSYQSAKREDLAEKEQKEIQLLNGFLPKQMSLEEVKKVVEGVIRQMEGDGKEGEKATGGKLLGMVMKNVGKLLDKDRVDGGMVSNVVKELLEGKKSEEVAKEIGTCNN